ncbi:MAG: hypothetical protein GY747_08860 [Planctomycetes bacterium]|nr:hypothetical protein [Planctomycetota bacterium]MCP4771297.1 hypothetical protein [Planctomycetota bacterium]MCP4860470.1 hypothetical protein [Planctomycetota bacterium]
MLFLLFALQMTSPMPLPAAEQQILLSPAPFHSVGFEWRGALPLLEVAILNADGHPGPWWPVVDAEDLSSHQLGARHLSALVHGATSDCSGLLIRSNSSSLPNSLRAIWIAVETPVAKAGSVFAPSTGASARAGASAVPPPQTAVNKPPVFSRSSWGANAASCTPSYCNTTHVALHHTASASEYASTSWSQCAANVKATQVYHMVTRGWCDIGYNYLICPHGDIFEGRGGGDNVRGAHDGYNCGSMGVSMMGYFHAPYNHTLTTAMKDSFVELAAWKCDQQNINPLGSSWYAGLGAVENNLYGHRDVSSTACPGDLAYAELPLLRTRVENRINGGGTTIILDNGAASYTGSWTTSNSAAGRYGPDYRWASTGTAQARAMWTPNIPSSGTYQVSIWWPAGSNRNPATLVGALLNSNLRTATVNQQVNGGQWNVLGSVFLPAGSTTTFGISNAGASGFVVIADALRLIKL